MGQKSLTHLHGEGMGWRGLLLQGMEVQAAVFKADSSMPALPFCMVNREHEAVLQQLPDGLRQAVEVIHLHL